MRELNPPVTFDLDSAVATWRTRLFDLQNIKDQDVQELEVHLREGIERLRALGLTVEEAFWVAARRLGDLNALSLEFAKVDHRQASMKAIRIAIGVLAVLQIFYWIKLSPDPWRLDFVMDHPMDGLSLLPNYLFVAAGFAGFSIALRPNIFGMLGKLAKWFNFGGVLLVLTGTCFQRITMAVPDRRASPWFLLFLTVPPFLLAVLLAASKSMNEKSEKISSH